MVNKIEKFWKESDGSATVELVIWAPLLLGFMVSAIDLAMIFYTQQKMYDSAYNSARAVALGRVTIEDAQSALGAVHGDGDDGEGAAAEVSRTEDGYIVAQVSVPIGEIAIFADKFISGTHLVAEAKLWSEEQPAAGSGS